MRPKQTGTIDSIQCAAQAQVQVAAVHDLVAVGTITRAEVQGLKGGFVDVFHCCERSALLGSARGKPRAFASLNTVVTLLQRLNQFSFEVNTSGFKPGRLRAARPDRAQAMRDINTRDQPRP